MWNSCNQGNQWWFGRLMNWWLIIKIEGSGICTLKDVTDAGWICRTKDSVDPSGKCWDRWIRRSIYWFIDPSIHWYTDLLIWGELPSLSLFLPSAIKHDLKFFFPSALLFGSFRDDSITAGYLFRCPTIHSGFATVFAERLEISIYQCGRICGRCMDDVSLSISSSFKETLNRFCASWGKQPLPFIPVALRSNLTVSKTVDYGRTRIGTVRHLVTCFSLNCFPQRSWREYSERHCWCTFFSLLLTHKVNSSWLCLSGFCFVCWFHIKNIKYATMLMLAYAPPQSPPPPPKHAHF